MAIWWPGFGDHGLVTRVYWPCFVFWCCTCWTILIGQGGRWWVKNGWVIQGKLVKMVSYIRHARLPVNFYSHRLLLSIVCSMYLPPPPQKNHKRLLCGTGNWIVTGLTHTCWNCSLTLHATILNSPPYHFHTNQQWKVGHVLAMCLCDDSFEFSWISFPWDMPVSTRVSSYLKKKINSKTNKQTK